MIEPRPSVVRFVSAVVHAEIERSGGAHDSDLTQRIMTRLHHELGKVIGPAGLDVLLARALLLARRAHPLLARITAGPGGTLAGFDEAAPSTVALQESATAIVAHFIELMVVLIGEDLAIRLLNDVWPALEEDEKK
jgi:hypothetical protein